MDPSLSVEELIREFDEPNLIGWKLFSQIAGFTIYRRPNEKIISYKCFSHFPDISPEISYKVAIDIEYRLIWDKYLKEGKKINDGDKQGAYRQVAMPLFIENRDYTFVQESGEYDLGDRHFYYAFTRTEPFQNEPPRKKVVRIENCQSQAVFCSDGANGVKSFLLYCEDPRGNFPEAIWSWVAKFGIPIYVKLAHNACQAYPEWLKDKKTVLSNILETDIDSAAATAAAAAVIMPANSGVDNDEDDEEEEEQPPQVKN